eukprot:442987_1
MVKTLMGSAFLPLYSYNIWFNRIAFIIGIISTFCIVIFHVLRSYCYLQENKMRVQAANIKQQASESNSSTKRTFTTTTIQKSQMQKYKSINTVVTIALMIFTMLFQIHVALGMFSALEHCGYFANVVSIWWHSSKCCIYYTFVLRMKMVFNNSAYAYSNKLLISLTAGITVFWMYALFGDLTEIYGTYEYVASENSFWCQVHLAIFGIIITGIVDSFLSIVCLILFVKPLICILKETGTSCTSKNVKNVVIKYFLLSFVQIASTAIFVICALFKLGTLAAIDVDINLLCILLMSSVHQKHYYFLCNPCHSIIERCQAKFTPENDINL